MLKDSIAKAIDKAGPEAFEPNQLQAAQSIGRTVTSAALAAAPLAGQVFDAQTTMQAYDEFKGRLQEANPILQGVVKTPWQFWLVKGLLGGAMGVSTWLLRKHHRDREATVVSVLGTAAGFVPAMLNRASMRDARERAGR